MARTVADQMVEVLAAAGVKRIYGVVGDSLNGFTDALRRAGGAEWLHVRHEEVGAFAAGADAHVTGGLAVCAGSCGPGNLHLINGLFDCHRSRLPVVAIAAQIPSPEIGSDYFQETHPEQLFKECSSYCELVSNSGADAARARDRGAPRDPRTVCLRRRHPGRRHAEGRRGRAGAETVWIGAGAAGHRSARTRRSTGWLNSSTGPSGSPCSAAAAAPARMTN